MASAEEVSGLLATTTGGLRLRDPFLLFLRDCVAAALKATERCALVIAHFQFEAQSDATPTFTAQDVGRILAPQEILCWLNATELAVVALGGGSEDGHALGERLRAWLDARGRDLGCVLTTSRIATASHSADGATIDEMLDGLGRTLATNDDPAASQRVA
jgi:hypothetical protein